MPNVAWYRFSVFLFCFVSGIISGQQARATHLMGGELTYVHSGSQSGFSYFDVRLVVYRYCDTTIVTAPLDQTMNLGIYTQQAGLLNWYATEILFLWGSEFINSQPMPNGCNFSSSACIERGEYYVTLILPDTTSAFHLIVERCCRNGNIINLNGPGQAGMTFYATIPPGIINSTPQISDVSVPYVCTGDTISIINNAYDPDGDSLAYAFVIPYNGNSSSTIPIPDPQIDNNPYLLPVDLIQYNTGYAFPNFLGSGGYASIDPVTGLTRYYFPNQGFYVAAIEIREYRNGALISAIRRDLQFISLACTPNVIPNFAPTTNGTVFSVPEGQNLCFNISFTDSDGDSLYLTASGPLLDSTLVNPAGSLPDAEDKGMLTSTFCWTPVCGMARSTPYQFSVSVTDNGCPPKTTNVVFSVFVTTSPASQYPSVVVQQNPPGMICQGSQVSFSAAPTLPGTNPLFTWYLNGTPVASGSPVFSPQSVSNGDIVSVTMITNAPCLLNDTAQSPPYVVQVNPQPAPQVSLTSNPALLLCPQQICLFTAAVANGGASPSYQWNLNGANTGTNNHLFTAANPSGLMAVFVTVTPSTGCPPVSSDTIVFNIQPWLTPQVQIVSNSPDSLCPGEEVMLRATATNTGSPPVFTWLFNTSQLNHPFDTLTIAALTANDSIRVQVTSNYECLSPSVATSDPYFIRIYPPLQANLTDGPIEVCAGTPVDLLMNASGGNTSTYQFSWDPGIDDDPEITVYPVNSGTWYATVDEICYDAITDSVEITAFPVPSASYSFTPEHPAVYDPVVTFTNLSTGSDSWLWKFGDGAMTDDFSPVHVYPSGGKFPVTLIAFNQNGCTDTATRLLEVEQPVIGFIPNSFTPNGDGINDSFGIEGEATGGYSLRIFNRWGQEVFSSPNGYQRWDGKFGDGKPAPAGIYTYVAVLANDPARKPVTGSVSLIR